MFAAIGEVIAQKKEIVLTNADVIEMVMSGLSENVAIAKIKSSKTNFDTSTDQLLKLKQSGVSDSLVTAMLESGSVKGKHESFEGFTIGVPVELKSAIGKRRVYIESPDTKSIEKIINVLKDAGFSMISEKVDAELIIRLTYVSDIWKGAYTKTLLVEGKFVVYVVDGNILHQAWFVEDNHGGFDPLRGRKSLYNVVEDFAEDFVKALNKVQRK